MNAYPYMPLYWNDLLSDNKVRVMSNEELGAYIRLLGVAWHEDAPGTLPAAENDLARLAGLEPAAWAEISSRVLACFVLNGRRGCYVQKRMVAEYKILCERSEKRRKAGANGNANRWKRESSGPSQCDNFANRKRIAKASLSESESESKRKEVTKVTCKKPPGCELPLPENLTSVAGFAGAWELLCTHRQEIKKAFKPTAGSRMLVKLSRRPGQAVAAINLMVDRGWQGFEWSWFDNSPPENSKPCKVDAGNLQAGEAELGNARMAYYTATGKLPFGMSDKDLLAWFSNHLAASQVA